MTLFTTDDRRGSRALTVVEKLWYRPMCFTMVTMSRMLRCIKRDPALWVLRLVLLGVWGAVIAFVLIRGPLATNDGPVHLAFSNLIATLGRPDHYLQHSVYTVEFRINPNLMTYLLLTALIRMSSAAAAHSIVQIACLVGPAVAGYLALRAINPRSAWLAVFILPLSLNQMFFLGLYNHCISTAAFFLAVGAYYWMDRSPSWRRAAILSATLVLTFMCHASGFLMTMVGIGTLSATRFTVLWVQRHRFTEALWERRYSLAAIFTPLPLAVIFLSSNGGREVSFGPGIASRLWQFGFLTLLRVNSRVDKYAAIAISLALVFPAIYWGLRVASNRQPVEYPWQRADALGAMSAALVTIGVMLIFPDILGGGWGHFRRFIVFPFFWALLFLALLPPFPMRLKRCLMAVGIGASVVLVGTMIRRQSLIQKQLVPLADVDRSIGNHCTVLPVVFAPEYPYAPFFQAASALELTGDRVVLFNFLARLNAYPVHFHPNMEPQRYIFHWKPQQRETFIRNLDIGGFEAISGMHVDYILLWGDFEDQPTLIETQVQSAIAQSRMVYSSPDDRLRLYQRVGTKISGCIPPMPLHEKVAEKTLWR